MNEGFDAVNGIDSCRSYSYGAVSEERYIHDYNHDRRVASASDDHDGPCEFGGDVF